MEIKTITRTILVMLLCTATSSVNASIFDGITLNYQYYFEDLASPWAGADNGDKVIGAGIEVANVTSGLATMDIYDDGFFVDFSVNNGTFIPAAYNGFVLTDVDNVVADFTTGFDYTLNTNMVGLTLTDLYLTPDGLGINWQNRSFNSDTFVELTLSAIPIPAAVWLFGTALIGLFGLGKRQKVVSFS